ncbi:MAG: glycosyltransferase family 39 protein [Tepidimonas sp.]|nr:glycosyltransferase family 39 protein [Tepidimonas sp.]
MSRIALTATAQPRAWGVWLLPLLAWFVGLGSPPLFDVDEGAFSEATRELLASGDWLSTWLLGAPRYDKPILIYWLQALAVAALGLHEWALRLPSALAAVGWGWAVWTFARQRWDAAAAERALLIVATALGPWIIARAATADALLNLWLTLACLDLWRFFEHGQRQPLWRVYLWVGLGLLTKGPVAALIPAAAGTLHGLLARDARRWRQAAFDPLGWLILLAVAAPWYLAMLLTHGQAFIEGFILRHNVQRFTGTLEGHGGHALYYLVALPLLLLPWSAALPAVLARLRADLRQPLARYLWLWAGFVLLFFSLSGTKLPHYVLYGATPLMLLLAQHLPALRAPWLLLAVAPMALWPWLPTLLVTLGARSADPYYAAQLALAQDLAPAHYGPLTWGALGLACAVALARHWPAWRRLQALAALQALLLGAVVAPWFGDVLQGAVRHAGTLVRQAQASAVLWRFDAPSFAVYAQAITPRREPEPGEWALTRLDRRPDVPHTVLYQRGGVVLLRRDR